MEAAVRQGSEQRTNATRLGGVFVCGVTFGGVHGHPFEQGFDLRLIPEKLADPLRWQTPKMIFVNSMSDLFHEGVADEYIEAVARVMTQADWHTYQVLTKRSARMRDLLKTKLRSAAKQRNIWWGVSIEDKRYGVPRISHLRESEAAVKFLSVEPLLEDLGVINLHDIDWMIVGQESGPGARPIESNCVRSLRKQCRDFRVKFFLKQWGGVRKHTTGRLLDGRTYDEFPVRTIHAVPESIDRSRLVSQVQQISSQFVPLTALAGD
ncbi:MAG: phage Gp37/Gp68 family protein [Deltaproteobacteria bacterium]|nr:phage Gp37/Gp68 family protein [Deltaproteobacteria bacterium]